MHQLALSEKPGRLNEGRGTRRSFQDAKRGRISEERAIGRAIPLINSRDGNRRKDGRVVSVHPND